MPDLVYTAKVCGGVCEPAKDDSSRAVSVKSCAAWYKNDILKGLGERRDGVASNFSRNAVYGWLRMAFLNVATPTSCNGSCHSRPFCSSNQRACGEVCLMSPHSGEGNGVTVRDARVAIGYARATLAGLGHVMELTVCPQGGSPLCPYQDGTHVCRDGEYLHSIEAVLSTTTSLRMQTDHSHVSMRTPPSGFDMTAEDCWPVDPRPGEGPKRRQLRFLRVVLMRYVPA